MEKKLGVFIGCFAERSLYRPWPNELAKLKQRYLKRCTATGKRWKCFTLVFGNNRSWPTPIRDEIEANAVDWTSVWKVSRKNLKQSGALVLCVLLKLQKQMPRMRIKHLSQVRFEFDSRKLSHARFELDSTRSDKNEHLIFLYVESNANRNCESVWLRKKHVCDYA